MATPLIGQDSPVSLLPQIVPPFTGAETLYIVDQNGVSSRVRLSDVMGLGIRQMKNAGIGINAPAFAIIAGNDVPGQFVLADNGALATARAIGVVLAPIAAGQVGAVQFNGYCAGFVGLTVGPMWLGSAGGILSAPPAGGSDQFAERIGDAISTTEAILKFDYPNGPL